MAASVGPFGTYDVMTFWDRMVFWFLDVIGGLAIVVPILHVFYFSRFTSIIPSIPRFLLGVALGAMPTAGYITVLHSMVGEQLQISTPYPLLVVQVTVFSWILLWVEFQLWPRLFGSPETVGRAEPRPDQSDAGYSGNRRQAPALLKRLPPGKREGQIISVSMQDHYAEVTTTSGSALILMRLSDAIEMLEDYPGLQIHRSHWVGLAQIDELVKRGRNTLVLLKDGRELPVGSTYLRHVKEQLVSVHQNTGGN